MPVSNSTVAKAVAAQALISDRKLSRAKRLAEKHRESLYRVLIDRLDIDRQTLNAAIAKYFGVPAVDLERIVLNHREKKNIPDITAKDQELLVFECNDEHGICIASDNPVSTTFAKQLEKKTGRPVTVYFSDSDSMKHVLERDSTAADFTGFAQTMQELIARGNKADMAEDLPIIQIVDEILTFAYINKTSDIHIEPYEDKTVVRLRIDGLLHDVLDLPQHLHELIIARIKILALLPTDEHRAAQDGKLRFSYIDETVDARVSIVPIVRGEKAVLRLLSDKSRRLDLEQLGFQEQDLAKMRRSMRQPWGMILATGPTGSGKTSTLYAILKQVNSREINISTIEDPVEYDMEGVNQIQVNSKTGLTFARGLRAIVRQDPNIIMVGEIRDEETASIAVNSAMTGHLVLSTLHTNDAATALPRLLEMGVPAFLVGTTINVIVAQRLVRRLCDHCRTEQPLSEHTNILIKQELSAETIRKFRLNAKGVKFAQPKGCSNCQQTGYRGRIGIYELLEMDDDIKRMVMEKANAAMIKQRAIEKGMVPMLDDGLEKVLQGVTTIEEIIRVSKE